MPRVLPYKEEVLRIMVASKINLICDGNLVPVVFAQIANKLEVYGLIFRTNEDKHLQYQSLWERILPRNPKFIITVNDIYGSFAATKEVKEYVKGSLQQRYDAGDPSVKESILLSVYPRGDHAWAVRLPYDRRQGPIRFEEPEYIENDDGLSLGGDLTPRPWAMAANRKFNSMKEG